MRARRGATRLCGIIAIDKPAGMTSHDVVSAVRRASGEGRIGHAGTLDPAATGLLVVLMGAYTRLAPYLTATTKAYQARIAFGSETDTDDAEGSVTAIAPVPEDIFDRERAEALLRGLLGESLQRPPAYSAIKVHGRAAHRIARQGGELALEARPVRVDLALLEHADAVARTWDVLFRVSKGTYVRALARDIGRVAGTRAHLAALRRTSSGNLDIRDAHALDDVLSSAAEGNVAEMFAEPFAALGMRRVEAEADVVAAGQALPRSSGPAVADGEAVAVDAGGRLAAVYRTTPDALVAEAVFPVGAGASDIVTWKPGMPSVGRAVVTLGVFDGVHIGHQALVRDTVAAARARGADAAVVTFDRDPDRIVDPEHAAPQLLELDDKLRFLAALGPDLVMVVPFDERVAVMPPGEFLDGVLARTLAPVAAIVGHDFRFGARAAGDLGTLAEYGASHGFDVVGHPLVDVDGAPVTSTRIRSLVADGDVAGAAGLLGRPHRLRGVVVAGRGEGAGLGAPTANLEAPSYAAVPADGVYAGRVRVGGSAHPAAISIGIPPMFPDASCRIEAYLLDFSGDLYGRTLDVEFLVRLREQRRFETPGDLAAAIAADVARVREIERAEPG